MRLPPPGSIVLAAALDIYGAGVATDLPKFGRNRLDSAIDAIANEPQHRLASFSVLAIRNRQMVYRHQPGSRSIDPIGPGHSKPADSHTLYRVASICKLVTALGVMKWSSRAGSISMPM